MTAGVACGSCGIGLRENAKFCDECGASTAVSSGTAKYKQVKVLFADVVRSMDIAAVVDMERFREIITRARGAVGGGGAALRRDGGVHRRRGHGAVRRPSCVGGSCFSSVSRRADHLDTLRVAATDTPSVLLAWFTWPDGTSTEPTKTTTNNVHTDDHYGDSVFRAIATRHPPARWSIPSGSEIAATSATSELPHYRGDGATPRW